MGHTKDFVHAGGDGVNRGSAADFVIKLRGELFATGDDFFAFLVVGVPGVFGFGAGLLPEGREGDLTEAIFNDFVTLGELSLFPEAELAGGLLYGGADLGYLLVCKGVVIDLFPFGAVVAIILSALRDKEM